VFERFCGLKVLPTDRTLSNWLKDFRAKSVDALSRLNADLIAGVPVHLFDGQDADV
jgi:hypothetical protein